MKSPSAMPEEAGLEPRRQAVIEVLKDRFARGEIEMAEYERRVTAAADARRAGELAALVSDLSRSAAPHPAVPDGTAVPAVKHQIVSIMGSRTQHGDWLRADAVAVYAIMGSVDLDFTEVRPGDRPVVVEVYAMMSNVTVTAPAGMPVSMDVTGVMADASVHRNVARERAAGNGIVVRGVAVMSTVRVRAPR